MIIRRVLQGPHAALAILCLLAVVLVAGCGGGGGGGESSSGDETTAAEETSAESQAGSEGEGSGSEGASSPGVGTPKEQKALHAAAGGASPKTKAEYVKAADAVCTKAKSQIEYAIGKFIGGDVSKLAKESSPIVEEVAIPRVEEEVAALQSLDVPAAASEAAQGLIAAQEKMIEEAEADPTAFLAEGKASTEARKTAQQLGFAVCGGL